MKQPFYILRSIKFILFFYTTIFLFACGYKKDYKSIFHDPILYSKTVHELNSVVMGNNFTPVVASRNYTYAAIAGYEIIAAGYPDKFISLAGQLTGLKEIPKPAVGKNIDFEYASLIAYCKVGEAVTFPEGSLQQYTDSLKQLATSCGMPVDLQKNSEDFALQISSAILAWSKKDNYSETRSASKFVVTDTPGSWQPTPPAYTQAVEPHWAEIRPLVMSNAAQFRSPPPPDCNITDTNSEYYKNIMLIKNATDSLTPEQKHIADFWDDNPFKMNVSGHAMFSTKKFSPTGHWMSIVGIAAQKANADFPTTVYAYAKTAITFFDAFIQCWDAKYLYKTARPETIINKYFDPNWHPYLQTPAFPEYTCGHSTISAAAAEALTNVFGDNFSYTDSTELEFGIKSRSFKSFRDAAWENNSARFYGGIHYHSSCIVANEYGKKVGTYVMDHLKMKK